MRGSRYTLALIAPIAVTGVVLAAPILEAWLGDGFDAGGAAMAILLLHWLVGGANGVPPRCSWGWAGARPWRAGPWPCRWPTWRWRWRWCRGWGSTARPWPRRSPSRCLPDLLALSARDAAGPRWTRSDAGVPAGLAARCGWRLALGAVRLAVEPEGPRRVRLGTAGGLAAYWAAYYRVRARPVGRAARWCAAVARAARPAA